MMWKVPPSPDPDLPQLPRSPFLHAVLTTPVDRTGACRFLSLPARPSPVNWRVGVHIQTSKERGANGFACNGFLPVLAGGSGNELSRPPQASLALRPARLQPAQGGLLFRGSDPA